MCDDKWISEEFSGIGFGDKRLNRRFFKTAGRLFQRPMESIYEACGKKTESKGAYRFFSNGQIRTQIMLKAHMQQTLSRIASHKVILAIQDTSVLGYTTHHETEGLGKLTSVPNAVIRGLLMHTALAVDLQGIPLGILDHRVWSRLGPDRAPDISRKRIPVKEKESFRWIKTLRKI